jgi:hypothetical protein
MLKIYLRRSKFELHNHDELIKLDSWSNIVIKDETEATPQTIEYGAYTDEAKWAYTVGCAFHQKKKGILATYWKWEGCAILKQWLAPNAKLIKYVTYEEYSCSMKELMNLPTTDVIAYLKQEGITTLLTN